MEYRTLWDGVWVGLCLRLHPERVEKKQAMGLKASNPCDHQKTESGFVSELRRPQISSRLAPRFHVVCLRSKPAEPPAEGAVSSPSAQPIARALDAGIGYAHRRFSML